MPRARRGSLAALLLGVLALLTTLAQPTSASAFGWDDVVKRARELANEGFYAGEEIPDWLAGITYDQWRDIRFKPEYATWREEELPFQVQFFHPGLFYNRPVKVNIVDGDTVSPAMFLPSQFDYGRNEFASRVPQTLGYAGFRLHAPIKRPDYFDEVIVFLGASYFRAVGRDQVFGLSARGLAIDTAEPTGEEFPFFREFWIEKPQPGDDSITVYALLDSPGLAGAYGFVIHPGEETVVEVYAELFPRRDIEKLGIAPLTSMFFHGENTLRKFDDFRPEAHDSDGLLIHFASGDWLWRPLDNPERLQISRFDAENVLGFGLVQRDREFASYEDLETQAQMRPSAWVEPIGSWGPGQVELVEIPTKSDTNDNIVAYWVPAREVKKGEPLTFAYRLYWYGDNPDRPPLARVASTRRDHGSKGDTERFVIDFAGGNIDLIPPSEILHGSLSIRPEKEAELVGQQVVKNQLTGEWRLTFQVKPRGSEPVDLRARLEWIGQPLTEIWAYTLTP
ncbi:MAG TPA: glucan biosynthesis protein G [Candidatus Binatia bacterium]